MEVKKAAMVSFKVTTAFYFEREVQEVGTTVQLPRLFAIEMQSANRGTIIPDEPTPSETVAPVAAPAVEETAKGAKSSRKEK